MNNKVVGWGIVSGVLVAGIISLSSLIWAMEAAEEYEVAVEASIEGIEPVEASEIVTVEVVEEIVEPEDDFIPYDIPLSEDLQRYAYDLCVERGLDFEIVLSLMFAESTYRENLISSTNDYGMMQINKGHHNWLKTELGIDNFLCGYQNIDAGTFMLAGIRNHGYTDVHQMLMVYNFGEGGAKKCWNRGQWSSQYSRKIVAKAEEIRNSR